jgi:integral membrane sensor domain MASE1
MPGIFKLNIGTCFSFAYLIFLMMLWVYINLSPPDALSGLAIVFLTLPWSFMFLDLADKFLPEPDAQYISGYLIVLSILLNMIILHFCGAVLTTLRNLLLKEKDLK